MGRTGLMTSVKDCGATILPVVAPSVFSESASSASPPAETPADPSSRLTPLKEADDRIEIRLFCWAAMSVWTLANEVPGCRAATTSALILSSKASAETIAAVAVATTEKPKFKASDTADSAPVSDFSVDEIDQ